MADRVAAVNPATTPKDTDTPTVRRSALRALREPVGIVLSSLAVSEGRGGEENLDLVRFGGLDEVEAD